MAIQRAMSALLNGVTTLKFKIVAVCACIAVLAAAVTTHFVLGSAQANTQRLLLTQDADARERSANLLSSKIELLETVLSSVAKRVTPELLANTPAVTRFMADQLALSDLFDATFIAASDGTMLARLQKGVPGSALPSLAASEYFLRVMQHGQPVVSKPFIGRVSKLPIVVFASPVKAGNGAVLGVVGGTLQLHSTGLLSFISREESLDSSREIVIDAAGTILAHPRPERILGRAEDEPGLDRAYRDWADNGRTIHAEGNAALTNGYLVSMAGLPGAEWMLVRVTPQSEALRPLAAGQATGWRVGAVVGLVAALLAGLLAWPMTLPITRLQRRAERLLHEAEPSHLAWPRAQGEIGALSKVFQHVVEQVHLRQQETSAMLLRLEAVLHNAEVGVAFSRRSTFELVSRHFCKIFGIEEAHAIGQRTRMIYPSDEAYQALSDRARPAFMAHGAYDGELELVRRNGESFRAHMRGRALEPGNLDAGTIWIIEDITAAHEQRERLTWTASHDSLTGLANRAAFEVLLETATAAASDKPFCALFIDLDRFKQVNDTAGHAAGDALLRDIAHILEAQIRQSDVAARLGGDEFAVVLNRCPTPKALEIAEKVRAAVAAYVLVWDGGNYSVGASIGLVQVDATFQAAADVVQAADRACYAAKHAGRNCVKQYLAQMPASPTTQPAVARRAGDLT